jgi:hypothetical protein
MKRLLSFAALTLALVIGAQAQYRPSGPPASVTSPTNPVPGSQVFAPGPTVTSGSFSPVFQPGVRVHPRRHVHNGNGNGSFGSGSHSRFGTQFTPSWAYGGMVAVPVPVPVPVDADGNPIDQEAAQGSEEDDRPAYTVFEHRNRSAVPMQDYADMRMTPRGMQAQDQPQPEPVSNQPATVLVFRDGHQLEVTNYAIQSGTLFNLSDAGPRKIALADLDVDKTVRANDQRGVDFTLPTAR